MKVGFILGDAVGKLVANHIESNGEAARPHRRRIPYAQPVLKRRCRNPGQRRVDAFYLTPEIV